MTYSWLILIDTPLFTMCVVTCIEASNIEVFDQNDEVLVVRIGVLCCKVCTTLIIICNLCAYASI